MSVDDATSLIVQASGLPCYQSTNESQQKIADIALAAEIRAALFDFPRAGVSASAGQAIITVKAPEDQSSAISRRIEECIKNVEGLDKAEIRVDPYF